MTTSNYLVHVDFTKAISKLKTVDKTKLSDDELKKAILESKKKENYLRSEKQKMLSARSSGKVGQSAVALADKNLLSQIKYTKELESELNRRSMKHSEDHLEHHGRLGMHWGKRNGPPYPLDFKKLSAEEKQKAKEDTIRRGDIQTAHRNRDHYTDQELNAVKTRFELNQKVAAIDRSLVKTGADKAEEWINKADRLFKNIDKIGNSYNIGRKVAITFGLDPDDLPKYSDEGRKKGK